MLFFIEPQAWSHIYQSDAAAGQVTLNEYAETYALFAYKI